MNDLVKAAGYPIFITYTQLPEEVNPPEPGDIARAKWQSESSRQALKQISVAIQQQLPWENFLMQASGYFYDKKDLSGADFSGVDFSGLTLEDLRFDYADFTAASFRGAALRRCTFTGTTLDKIDFSGARLEDIRFGLRDITQADFSGAELKKVYFGVMEVKDCRFAEAKFTEVTFQFVGLPDAAAFEGVDLSETKFYSCE